MCVLKYLLECGVDPAMPDSSRGCTPLHCAAEEGVLSSLLARVVA